MVCNACYTQTQRKILEYLFNNFQGVINDFSNYTNVNEKTIKVYLNNFVEQSIIERISKKQRDKNALYVFKKA